MADQHDDERRNEGRSDRGRPGGDADRRSSGRDGAGRRAPRRDGDRFGSDRGRSGGQGRGGSSGSYASGPREFERRERDGGPRGGGDRPYRDSSDRRSGGRDFRAGGSRDDRGAGRPDRGGDRPYRPARDGDRPYGDRPFRREGDRPSGGGRPFRDDRGGDRPFRGRDGERPARRDGDRPFRGDDRGGDRPFRGGERGGDRPFRSDRGGDRPFRSDRGGDRPFRGDRGSERSFRDGDRASRPSGDRPFRGGDRPERRDGDRPFRGDRGGERPFRSDRDDRPERRDRDRPFRSDRAGDRPERRDGDRPFRSDRGGDRPERRDGDRPFRGREGDRPQRRDGDRSARGGREERPRFGDGSRHAGARFGEGSRDEWEDRDPYGTRSVRERHDDPDLPEEISARDLHPQARAELKTLSKDNADWVAKHLVAAALFVDEDPELANRHALSAARRAGRVAVVRETMAITAYRLGDFATALRELRTYRRISGRNDQLPMMVDCERGLGRPERALELGRSVDKASLDAPVQVELAIAMSGARLDLGNPTAALGELEIPQLDPSTAYSWSPALYSAYAATLEELGRQDEADEWSARAQTATEALAEVADDDAWETVDVVEETFEVEGDGGDVEPVGNDGAADAAAADDDVRDGSGLQQLESEPEQSSEPAADQPGELDDDNPEDVGD